MAPLASLLSSCSLALQQHKMCGLALDGCRCRVLSLPRPGSCRLEVSVKLWPDQPFAAVQVCGHGWHALPQPPGP